MTTASGSTSGSVTSRSANGWPGPKKTAALPLIMSGLSSSPSGRIRARRSASQCSWPLPSKLERVVQRAHGQLCVLVLDDTGHRDLGGRDHLDVDALARHRAEHARG